MREESSAARPSERVSQWRSYVVTLTVLVDSFNSSGIFSHLAEHRNRLSASLPRNATIVKFENGPAVNTDCYIARLWSTAMIVNVGTGSQGLTAFAYGSASGSKLAHSGFLVSRANSFSASHTSRTADASANRQSRARRAMIR